MTTLKDQARKELAIRTLEKRYEKQRNSLLEFMKFYREREKKRQLDINRHIEEICKKLEAVYMWDIKRLMINIPPRSLKTELISKAFPVWWMWNDPTVQFMWISYSHSLAESNSMWARDIYESETYKLVFPRKSIISEDQNTKKYWTTKDWGQYYASWSSWSITWVGATCIAIDDPLKPNEAESDIIRPWVNNNYHNTIKSRLNDRREWSIIIVMQRLHDDDLCWHLLELEDQGLWDKRDKLIIPAIWIEDTSHYKIGESFFEKRFPVKMLKVMKQETPVTFSTQYQQDPVNKETQEFHEERFRYYTRDQLPKKLRIFTACDPAFSKKQSADNTAIITWGFDWMDLYILEMSVDKYDPAELIDKLIYHYLKRKPEKIWVEAFQAQQIIGFNLKAELQRRWHSVNIEDLRQTGDKETKIRKLIPLYRNWHIYHTLDLQGLEMELKRFPRGRHDDQADVLQMIYSMYEAMPNARPYKWKIEIKYDEYWRPIMVDEWFDIYTWN